MLSRAFLGGVSILGFFLAACGGDSSTVAVGGDGGGGGDDGGVTGDGGIGGDGSTGGDGGTNGDASSGKALKTIFLILMENHNWSAIKGASTAPYINGLLATGAHAEQYMNPPGLHPSEPNYIWLEAGGNLGITNDSDPSANHKANTDHLVTQLETAGVTWKHYVEDITGTTCPLTSSGLYGAKHSPMVFFDDVTNTNSPTSARCIAHIRPYTELAGDLTMNKIAQYNFITPNLCNDMHGALQCATNNIQTGDTWLSVLVPKIQASQAYIDGGAIFITWDESEGGDHPVGMIVLSKSAKVGYMNSLAYTHSSMLRTVETVFGVPFLRDAANAKDLGDLFTTFP